MKIYTFPLNWFRLQFQKQQNTCELFTTGFNENIIQFITTFTSFYIELVILHINLSVLYN